MQRTTIFLGSLTLLLLAGVSVHAAQRHRSSGTASLSGTVLGPDDRPAPHAAITYQSSGGNAPHAVHADAHGHFSIPHLVGDNYDLRASANGVFSEWEKNVTVHPGQQKTITLRLIYARQMPKTGTPAKNKQ